MRIGVCIPCIGSHIQYLEKCLNCIENQTQKPDMISISISSFKDQQLNINTKIPIFLEVTKEKRCASENRNIAASKICGQVDILTFLDVDDFMHPEKIHQVYQYFKRDDIDCFVHEFLDYPKNDYFRFNETKFCWPKISGVECPYISQLIREPICGRLYLYELENGNKIIHHNAHLSCRTNVWRDIKWPEEYKVLGEDSEFNFRVFSKGYKYIVTKDKLSLYCL
jgi:glycosyltransferase involved in cell wall biosynthesis